MNQCMQGRVVVVTGAGSVGPAGVTGAQLQYDLPKKGRACSPWTRSDHMEETAARIRQAGGEIITHQCDVTDSTSVLSAVLTCIDVWKRIDVLVNNVGGSAAGGP